MNQISFLDGNGHAVLSGIKVHIGVDIQYHKGNSSRNSSLVVIGDLVVVVMMMM
jgi:hypothetical protein